MIAAGSASALLFLFCAPLAPIPVLTISVGLRRAVARAASVVALGAVMVAVLLGLVAGNPGKSLDAAVDFLALVGLSSLAMCILMERRVAFDRIVVITAAIVVAASAAIELVAAGSPEALAAALHASVTASLAQGQKFWSALGFDVAGSSEFRASLVTWTVQLAPALCAIFAALMVLINLAIFWRFSGGPRRLGYPLFGDIVRWATPEWLVWLLLAAGFGLFIPNATLSLIMLNCFVGIVAVYFFQGLAIMAFYFRALAMPSLARGLVYALTIVQPFLAALICIAGVFDLWLDLRRLKPPSREARNLGDYS